MFAERLKRCVERWRLLKLVVNQEDTLTLTFDL